MVLEWVLGTQTPSGALFFSRFFLATKHTQQPKHRGTPPGQLLSIAAEGIAELTVGRGTPGDKMVDRSHPLKIDQ